MQPHPMLASAAALLLLSALLPQAQAFHENLDDAQDMVVRAGPAVQALEDDPAGVHVCILVLDHGCGGGGGGGGNPPPSGMRDDDGEMDTFVDMDYSDDQAVKRIAIPSGAFAGKTSATLHVYGKADACGAVGAAHRLTANGVPVADYDPCSKWGTGAYSWATFSVPLSGLTAGTENPFEILEIAGDWTDRNAYLGVDADNDAGRSDIHQSSSYFTGGIGGELMWYLTLA